MNQINPFQKYFRKGFRQFFSFLAAASPKSNSQLNSAADCISFYRPFKTKDFQKGKTVVPLSRFCGDTVSAQKNELSKRKNSSSSFSQGGLSLRYRRQKPLWKLFHQGLDSNCLYIYILTTFKPASTVKLDRVFCRMLTRTGILFMFSFSKGLLQ